MKKSQPLADRLQVLWQGMVLFGLALSAAAQTTTPAGQWSQTGRLPVAMSSHTATCLADGQILVVGGGASSAGITNATNAAALYDPATGKWTPTGKMLTKRAGHTASLLPDGRVLVVGGEYSVVRFPNVTNYFLNTAEIYNPATRKWTRAASMLSSARSGHTATTLADGRILVTGGMAAWWHRIRRGSWTAGAEIYNPSSGKWTSAGNLSSAKSGHAAALLSDGRVMVTGGYTYGRGILKTVDLFDPAAAVWSSGAPMATARMGHFAVTLPSGNVLVGGAPGSPVCEVFDASTGMWTATGNQPAANGGPAILLGDGRVLSVQNNPPVGLPPNPTAIYDPSIGTWAAVPSPFGSRLTGFALTACADGGVLLSGGGGYAFLGPNGVSVTPPFDAQVFVPAH